MRFATLLLVALGTAASAQQPMAGGYTTAASPPVVQTAPVTPPVILRVVQPGAQTTPPGSPPGSAAVKAPKARRAAQDYVTPADYPPAAIAARQQGRVVMLLQVEAGGRVSGCSILASSGSATLDRASCNILRRRARFIPALDRDGHPVAGTIKQTIVWHLR